MGSLEYGILTFIYPNSKPISNIMAWPDNKTTKKGSKEKNPHIRRWDWMSYRFILGCLQKTGKHTSWVNWKGVQSGSTEISCPNLTGQKIDSDHTIILGITGGKPTFIKDTLQSDSVTYFIIFSRFTLHLVTTWLFIDFEFIKCNANGRFWIFFEHLSYTLSLIALHLKNPWKWTITHWNINIFILFLCPESTSMAANWN